MLAAAAAASLPSDDRGCVVFHAGHKSAGVTILSTLRAPAPGSKQLTTDWYREKLSFGMGAWNRACKGENRSLPGRLPEAQQTACLSQWGRTRNTNFVWEGPRLPIALPAVRSPSACLLVCMIREPVARLVSALYYCRHQQTGTCFATDDRGV